LLVSLFGHSAPEVCVFIPKLFRGSNATPKLVAAFAANRPVYSSIQFLECRFEFLNAVSDSVTNHNETTDKQALSDFIGGEPPTDSARSGKEKHFSGLRRNNEAP